MQSRPLVLVLDDDPDFHALIQYMLQEQGYEALCLLHPDEVAACKRLSDVQVILLDWQLGELDGTTMIAPLKRRFPAVPIIFVTAHISPEVAACSIKLGAHNFLTKPLDTGKLMITIAQAVEHNRLLSRLQKLESGSEQVEFEGMVGGSPQMQTVYSIIRNVSPTDVSVMICGESGTGKELVAAAIHQRSDRQTGPYVPINMASIPHDLAEATIFGHEKGAFTGADKQRLGAVGEAIGGTLFLDEITEMPIELQSKLLRFLQERVYRPVGGNRDLKADVRIVSATNRDPMIAVKENRLREDLFYRLNVIPINLPPLREREGDISLLATHVMKNFAKQYSKSFGSIAPAALRVLERYSWPGNVRQLVHTMQRTVVLYDADILEAHMLPDEIGEYIANTAEDQKSLQTEVEADSPIPNAEATKSPDSAEAVEPELDEIVPLEALERQAIANALKVCDGSVYEAAKKLGISAATMYRRIKLYGLEAD